MIEKIGKHRGGGFSSIHAIWLMDSLFSNRAILRPCADHPFCPSSAYTMVLFKLIERNVLHRPVESITASLRGDYQGIERIINFFPVEELSLYRSLRSAIRCVTSQSLLPTDDGKQFQLFYQYVAGTNAVMQQCLGDGKGLRPLRDALAEHALMYVDGPTSNIDDNTRRRMTGLMSINPRLIEAVL